MLIFTLTIFNLTYGLNTLKTIWDQYVMLLLLLGRLTCKELVGSEPMTLGKGNVLNKAHPIPLWGPEFEIKLDILFNDLVQTGYLNIFRFAAVDGNYNPHTLGLGQRSPSLFMHNRKLYLNFNTGSGYKILLYSNNPFTPEKGTWYHIKISQTKDKVDFPLLYSKQYCLAELIY